MSLSQATGTRGKRRGPGNIRVRTYILDDAAVREYLMGQNRFPEKARRIRILYNAVKVVAGPMQKYDLKLLVAETRHLFPWKCVPLMILYSCDISEDKDLSGVQHSN